MSTPRILLQLDTDPQPSVFDAVVAADADVQFLLRHGSVTKENVRDLVYGTMFTRAPDQLHNTAIFVGGSSDAAAEGVLEAVKKTFFGPVRVSVMLDASGANTTAAAAVLAALKHLKLEQTEALVLGGTGPVGVRVTRLLALAGANVRVGSRSFDRAEAACATVQARQPDASLTPHATDSAADLKTALEGVQLVISAGAPGAMTLPATARAAAKTLRAAIDLNAVPPLGIEGIAATDKAVEHDGVTCYGAIGIGGTKMKIHKAAIRSLFANNTSILDAEEIFEIGRSLK